MKKNILYIGQFVDASGYGNAARGYVNVLDKYLDKSKYNLKLMCLQFEKKDFASAENRKIIDKYLLTSQELQKFIENEEYILLFHTLPHIAKIKLSEYCDFQNIFNNKNCKKRVGLVAWETTKVPQIWKDVYIKDKLYDELIVFCNWNKEIFESETGLKCTVAYHPIYDHFDGSKKTIKEKFRIFSMSQWQHRKGFDILIRAFYQEFFNQQDVELFIKTYRSETSPGFSEEKERNIIIEEISRYKKECSSYGKLPECKLLLKTGFCEQEEIKKLYEEADVFCSPTRGEGFGMTIAQAALSGLPCIVPDKGGHLDYINANSNYLIDSRFESVYNMPFPFYSSIEMEMIEPSLKSTRQKMREAYNDWKSNNLINRGLETKEYASMMLDEYKIYKNLSKVLE